MRAATTAPPNRVQAAVENGLSDGAGRLEAEVDRRLAARQVRAELRARWWFWGRFGRRRTRCRDSACPRRPRTRARRRYQRDVHPSRCERHGVDRDVGLYGCFEVPVENGDSLSGLRDTRGFDSGLRAAACRGALRHHLAEQAAKRRPQFRAGVGRARGDLCEALAEGPGDLHKRRLSADALVEAGQQRGSPRNLAEQVLRVLHPDPGGLLAQPQCDRVMAYGGLTPILEESAAVPLKGGARARHVFRGLDRALTPGE